MMDGTLPPAPRPLGDENAHYWLVQRMAKATGVDLVSATEAGLLDQDEWAGIVAQCRGCQWAQGCDRWLGAPVSETRNIPELCLNQSRFSALKDALETTTP
jgi:hypothetical protein